MAINVKELIDDVSSQFRDLNGLHPGLWPLVPRLSVGFGVLVVVLILSWFFYWDGQNEEIKSKVRY